MILLYVLHITVTPLSIDNSAAICMDCLPTNRATVCTRKEDKASCNLARLRRPSNRCGELFDGIVIHRSRNKWCPDRPRCNSVDADAPSNVLVAQTACEGDNSALGRRVIEEVRPANISVDGSIVDDRRAGLHVRQRIFGEIEVRVYVGIEGVNPLFLLQIFDVFDHHLVGCVVDQDIDTSELFHGIFYQLLAVVAIGKVGRMEIALSSLLFNKFLGLLSILVLLWKVRDENVCTFHGVENGC